MVRNAWRPNLPPFRKFKKDTYKQIIKTGEFVYQIGESDDLRKKSKPVHVKNIKTKEFSKKINYLKGCLLKYRRITGFGRGISAVQVGIPEAFSIIYFPDFESFDFAEGKQTRTTNRLLRFARNDVDKYAIDKEGLLVIINPKITKKSKILLKYPEMCMSAAPIVAEVIRPAWIEFEYYDESGVKRFWKIKDTNRNNRIYNRVFQHEIDHINGIINIDKVDSKKLIFQLDPKFYGKAEFKKI